MRNHRFAQRADVRLNRLGIDPGKERIDIAAHLHSVHADAFENIRQYRPAGAVHRIYRELHSRLGNQFKIDERFNGGGQVADYIVDYLGRTELSHWATRYGEDFTTPQNAIFGPKVMIINQYAGSGGDALPWMFRQRHIGPLVGERTWGGLVGIFGFPQLIDGGFVTAPNLAFWNPFKNDWDIENHGVAPDIEVEQEPAAVRAGHDPQLEKAVEVAMAELQKHPLPVHKRPPFPNYHKSTATTTDGGR